MTKMNSSNNDYVIYRIVLELEDSKGKQVADQLQEIDFDDAFSVSWFPQGNIREILVRQKLLNPREKTADRIDKRMKHILLIDGIVKGFVERYTCSNAFKLTSNSRATLRRLEDNGSD
jgi:hypothetical protein